MAGFTKLFNSILDSTIWQEPNETRLLWITMLAMSNANGEVQASIPGLARRAGISLPECEAGLHTLLSPDPYSRTPDHEGRRIENVDGGWSLLNHGRYRALLSAEERREYNRKKQAEYRAKKSQAVNDKSITVNHSEQNAHITEAEDRSREKKECPIPPVASDETRSFLDSLWKLSPRTSRPRTSRKDVAAAWKSIPAKDRPTHDEALAAYLAWTKCEAWTKENGQYVCGLHLWIRKRQWENVPEGATPGATPGAGCRKLSNEKGF
jgi:hypothetical protein